MADKRDITFGMGFGLDEAIGQLQGVVERLEGITAQSEEVENAGQRIGTGIAAGTSAASAGADGLSTALTSFEDSAEGAQEAARGAGDAASEMGDKYAAVQDTASNGLDFGLDGQDALLRNTSTLLDGVGASVGRVGRSADEAEDAVSSAFRKMGADADGFGKAVSVSMGTALKSGTSTAKSIQAGFQGAVGYTEKKFTGMFSSFKKGAQSMGTAIAHPIKTIKGKLGEALTGAGAKTDELGQKANKASGDLDNMGKAGAGAGANIGNAIKSAIGAFIGFQAIKKGVELLKNFVSSAIEAAGAAENAGAKFNAMFAGTDAAEWVGNYANAVHRSVAEVESFMVSNKSMYTQLGITSEAANDLSKITTSLAYDFGNAFKMSDADALSLMQDAISGNTAALSAYGIQIDDAALKATAMQMGLGSNIDALDDAAMAQVRLNTILEQTGDIQQAAINSTGGLVNSTKSLKGIWDNFLSTAGAKFAPTLESLFSVIMDAYPTVEPMLMGFVDVLSNGISEALPGIIQLGKTLIPLLSSVIGRLLESLMPILPVVTDLIGTLLPPLVEIFGELASQVLPPLVDIFSTLIESVIKPLLPVVQELITALLPPFVSLLGMISPVIQMLAPVLAMLGELLTPIASLLGDFIQTLLPPLLTILNTLFTSVIQPLMPVITTLVEALLPPIASLLGVIAPLLGLISPILEALSPVLEIIGSVLGVIGEILGKVIGFLADGVGKVVGFFSSLFGGAKDSKQEIQELSGAVDGLDSATSKETSLVVDTSDYKAKVEGAAATTSAAIKESSNEAKEITDVNFLAMGASSTATYGQMATDAESAWARMTSAAEKGARSIVEALKSIGTAANAINSTASVSVTSNIPHNAKGDDNFEGGATYMNEEGGEIAVLPKGSTIIPADKSAQIVNNINNISNAASTRNVGGTTNNVNNTDSSVTKTTNFTPPPIIINIHGNPDRKTIEEMKAELEALFGDLYKKAQEADYAERALQAGLT